MAHAGALLINHGPQYRLCGWLHCWLRIANKLLAAAGHHSVQQDRSHDSALCPKHRMSYTTNDSHPQTRHTTLSPTSNKPFRQATSPLVRTTMPSPRTSPAMRPTSPRTSSSHFDTLQPPTTTQRPLHSRTNSNNQRRAPNNSLKLP